MSIGPSGRIVIEIDPDLKRSLYGILVSEGISLKEWFVRQAKLCVENSEKSNLNQAVEESSSEK